ncbi:putative membrane protein [Lysobacter antibioticus]|uniref:Transmembrane protein n=1 Tax=Lysobacter antibioticus TaxID=84531 RepID=A0A0S2DVK3_LYSAN|nr:hypothetical protein [Lysobacter antibioticus]ALN62537.1 putative membrane protein [Lysobacter antibioticus]ALN80311.1 hypothetical protein LA76x_2172 [Lysobacter antibioticus]
MPPSSPQTSPAPQSPARFNPALPIIGLALSGLGGISPLLLVPRFEPMFAILSMDLPLLTQTLIDYPWVLCPLPLLVLALWMLWPKRRRDLVALLFGGIAGIGAGALAVIAMYLPIFRLAQAL